MKQVKSLKKLWIVFMALMSAFLLGACGTKKTEDTSQENNISTQAEQTLNYMEQTYGIADNPLYGTRIVSTEKDGNTISTVGEERINKDSKGGSVFCRKVNPQGQKEGLLGAYLSDSDGGRIKLEMLYVYDSDNPDGGSYCSTLPTASTSMFAQKVRCYIVTKDDYVAKVSLYEEKENGSEDLQFTEDITVYRMTGNGLEEEFNISRDLNSNKEGKKQFRLHISNNSTWYVYASGYINYRFEGAELMSTQQEFCDKANELLKSCSLTDISLNKTSWNNRWYGVDVEESSIESNAVKVDFSATNARKDENGSDVEDIIVKINDKEQNLQDSKNLEVITDDPVSYYQNTDTTNPFLAAENKSQSANESSSVNEASDVGNFNIDGFWYSTDHRYVYHIYTQNPDNGFGTLYFVDMQSKSKSKHGQVKQLSSQRFLLKAMETGMFSPEVSVSGNQLIAEEITLERVEDSVANRILGTWTNGNVTYTFDTKGEYQVKKSSDSYWGQYYFNGENELVMGRSLSDFQSEEYRIEGNQLILGDYLTLSRQ